MVLLMDNVYDVKREKNLNYILPAMTKLGDNSSAIYKGKVAVVIHLYYLDTVKIYLKYIEAIPDSIDILLTFSNCKMKEILQNTVIGKRKNCRFIEKQNRGRDISAFLVTCRKEIMQYEYICFLHDKKEKKNIYKRDVEDWIKCLWENMLCSTEYIENVLLTFDKNPTLGLLVPPFPITEHLASFYMYVWGHNFDNARKLAERMELECDLDVTKPPITLGTIFWARTTALRRLLEIDWKYEYFDEEPLKNDGTISHAIERILAYVAQDAGFESGWVMSDQYAGLHFEQMQYALKSAFDKLNVSLGISWISEIGSYENKVKEILRFVNKYERLYIYGAGVCGTRYLTILKIEQKVPNAFLVSDSSRNPKVVQGIPVYSISEVELNEHCGIIIGVSEPYEEEVIKTIKINHPEFDNIYTETERDCYSEK